MKTKMKLTPITCTHCGKRIVKGRPIYKIPGLYYQCCSPECLLDLYANVSVITSTGYEETQDEEDDNELF